MAPAGVSIPHPAGAIGLALSQACVLIALNGERIWLRPPGFRQLAIGRPGASTNSPATRLALVGHGVDDLHLDFTAIRSVVADGVALLRTQDRFPQGSFRGVDFDA